MRIAQQQTRYNLVAISQRARGLILWTDAMHLTPDLVLHRVDCLMVGGTAR